jgi:hypothetical protein
MNPHGKERSMADRFERESVGASAAPAASGGSGLPGGVIDAAAAAATLGAAPDADLLVALAARAGIRLDKERAARLAPTLAATVDAVRRATPLRRDQLAPALVFRVPREV